ncbi:hypothetical protein AAD16_005221 [Salmonella enterica subsp. diarizonae]|nr:hypothetical protein [Salmonella enterica subsp. diarizonae]EDY0793244.1 hypothetical protein [Salmonella enterica subsp. diarizonae]
MMNKKYTIHHLLFFTSLKTMNYNMMMMHEKSIMHRIPRPRSRPWRTLPGSTFFLMMLLNRICRAGVTPVDSRS